MESSFPAQLKTLHDRAKRGPLGADERRTYERESDELARALGARKRSTPAAGETWLSVLRLARHENR